MLVKAACKRIVYVDHIADGAESVLDGVREAGKVRIGVGRRLLETLREIRVLGRAFVGNGNVTPVPAELALEVNYFGRHRSGVIRDGVGFVCSPRLPHGGHVIDVDAETDHG